MFAGILRGHPAGGPPEGFREGGGRPEPHRLGDGGDGRRLLGEQGAGPLQAAGPDVGGGRGAERLVHPAREVAAAHPKRAGEVLDGELRRVKVPLDQQGGDFSEGLFLPNQAAAYPS